jgi:hypothetical protein
MPSKWFVCYKRIVKLIDNHKSELASIVNEENNVDKFSKPLLYHRKQQFALLWFNLGWTF